MIDSENGMKRNGGVNEGVLNALFVVSLALFVGLITHKVSFTPPEPVLNVEADKGTLLNQKSLQSIRDLTQTSRS